MPDLPFLAEAFVEKSIALLKFVQIKFVVDAVALFMVILDGGT